jgi:uncharacterized membrane protein YagU involved in acid resistance
MSLWRATLWGGLAGAVGEFVPLLPLQAASGVGPVTVLHAIAGGLLGQAAYAGGAATALLGLALHLAVSVAWAGAFAWTARRWDDVRRHPLLAGLAFGLIVFAVMSAVVLPFTAVTFPPNRTPAAVASSLAMHMIAFALPLAWVVARVLARSR